MSGWIYGMSVRLKSAYTDRLLKSLYSEKKNSECRGSAQRESKMCLLPKRGGGRC